MLENDAIRLLLSGLSFVVAAWSAYFALTNWRKDQRGYSAHLSEQDFKEETIDLDNDDDMKSYAQTKTVATSRQKVDDFTKIEGIGPKINAELHKHGMQTFEQLADTDVEELKEFLKVIGARFVMHDPESWPQQAELAADGEWDALKAMQKELS